MTINMNFDELVETRKAISKMLNICHARDRRDERRGVESTRGGAHFASLRPARTTGRYINQC